MSRPTTTRPGPPALRAAADHLDERRADPLGELGVELVGVDAADVVGLDDLAQVAHGGHPSARRAGACPTAGPDRPRASRSGQSRRVAGQIDRAQHAQVAAPTHLHDVGGGVLARAAGPPHARRRPGPRGRRCWVAARRGPAPGGRPPTRGGQSSGSAVDLAQVVAVRLGVGGQRPEHGRGVGVDVRQRRDGRPCAGRLVSNDGAGLTGATYSGPPTSPATRRWDVACRGLTRTGQGREHARGPRERPTDQHLASPATTGSRWPGKLGVEGDVGRRRGARSRIRLPGQVVHTSVRHASPPPEILISRLLPAGTMTWIGCA